jgi:hypothetical protein
MGEVFCSPCHLSVYDAFYVAQVMIHTYVNDFQVEAMLSAKHVHATATLCEVQHLLPSHFPWRHADTFSLYAMVASEKQVAWM